MPVDSKYNFSDERSRLHDRLHHWTRTFSWKIRECRKARFLLRLWAERTPASRFQSATSRHQMRHQHWPAVLLHDEEILGERAVNTVLGVSVR